ncbi:MAG: hypothetical protein Q8O67_15360 [Deltaproteobacteria bacterium]|nr:hypothetical protein [Deltaproteobacteria bacterium]
MNHDPSEGLWNQLKQKDEPIDDDFLKSATGKLFALLQRHLGEPTEAHKINNLDLQH